ncbi:hypothetical protein D3C87_1307380 [compost metagenome]
MFDVAHQLAHAHQIDGVQGQGDQSSGRLRQVATHSGGDYHDVGGSQGYGSRNRCIACHAAINQKLIGDLYAGEHQRNGSAGQ